MEKKKTILAATFAVYLAAAVYLLFMRHAASDMLFSEYVRQNTNFIPFSASIYCTQRRIYLTVCSCRSA